MKNLEKLTDLKIFSKIFVLANDVDQEHNALIQGFKRKHRNIVDIHCSPRGLSGCVIAMQNAIFKLHLNSLVIKIDEDLFVTEGWLEGLLNSYKQHSHNESAIIFSPTIPNNWVGRYFLNNLLCDKYEYEYSSKFNVMKNVHTDPDYGVWIWNKIIEDNLEEVIRNNAHAENDLKFNEALNINCILFDSRLMRLVLPFTHSDEAEINSSLKRKGYHGIMTSNSIAHHYSFGPQQKMIDKYIGMNAISRYFDKES